MKTKRLTVLYLLFYVFICGPKVAAQAPLQPLERHRYKIDFNIDFEHLSYTGVETVRWINRGEKPTNVIYFHLYANLRTSDQQPLTNTETTD